MTLTEIRRHCSKNVTVNRLPCLTLTSLRGGDSGQVLFPEQPITFHRTRFWNEIDNVSHQLYRNLLSASYSNQ